jgi:Ras-related protein Rab-1A
VVGVKELDGELVHSIIYTEFHDDLGPNPIFYLPTDLPESIRMLVGIKTITLLSGDQGFVPESLIIIPFPSIRLKGIIKYIEWKNGSKKGKVARSAITFLFKEADEIIFYKYIDYLNAPFNETARTIIELGHNSVNPDLIYQEITLLRESIKSSLEKYRLKEHSDENSLAFPDRGKHFKSLSDFKFKLIVVGDPGVGKSSTILRFTDNAFNRQYIPTLGVNITDKSFKVNKFLVETIIWDLGGQEKFKLMRKHFYQGAEGVILIFDLTNPTSFQNIRDWNSDIKNHLADFKAIPRYLLGNKNDLKEIRKIVKEDAIELAEELDLNYLETSALTGKNIEYAFYKIAEELIETKKVKGMFN